MSDIYAAQLAPTKPEAVATFLSARLGTPVSPADVQLVTSFRFDDPAGEVGCETHVARVDVPDHGELLLQVPLTYRGAPLDGAPEEALVTTMEHSVLGDRWVYDATHDPIYATELLLAITDAGGGAEQFRVGSDGSRTQIVDGLASVRGTGAPAAATDAATGGAAAEDASQNPAVEEAEGSTIVRLRGAAVEVVRVLDASAVAGTDAGQLIATWDGQETPVVLARIIA